MAENRCLTCGNDSIVLVKAIIDSGRNPYTYGVGLKEITICYKCLIEFDKMED